MCPTELYSPTQNLWDWSLNNHWMQERDKIEKLESSKKGNSQLCRVNSWSGCRIYKQSCILKPDKCLLRAIVNNFLTEQGIHLAYLWVSLLWCWILVTSRPYLERVSKRMHCCLGTGKKFSEKHLCEAAVWWRWKAEVLSRKARPSHFPMKFCHFFGGRSAHMLTIFSCNSITLMFVVRGSCGTQRQGQCLILTWQLASGREYVLSRPLLSLSH